jgi:hypothetical protein
MGATARGFYRKNFGYLVRRLQGFIVLSLAIHVHSHDSIALAGYEQNQMNILRSGKPRTAS